MTAGVRAGRSESIRRRLWRAIPGGCHTYSKGDESFPANAPAVVERGRGAWVWDAEGLRYLDMGMGLRSVLLGHARGEVLQAVREWLPRGANHTRPTELEAELAEELISLIPCAEMVKFTKNGSNATTAAVRLARAFTGRTHVALCGDHPFFSFDDWFIGTTACPAGVPPQVRRLSCVFRYNDIDSLKRLFRRHRKKIACVVMEPATSGVEPEPGFLEDVRALCDREGALLVFDEIITGFRWHLRGAGYLFGVLPDLATFGKALGNGFSVSALVGRKDVMRLGGDPAASKRVFLLSTTHGAETHALAAARATLSVLRALRVPARIAKEGRRWIRDANRVLRKEGVDAALRVFGHPSSPLFDARDERGNPSPAHLTLLLQELARHGILAPPSMSLSLAHGARERRKFLSALGKAAARYRRALDEGLEKHLEVPIIRPVFRATP